MNELSKAIISNDFEGFVNAITLQNINEIDTYNQCTPLDLACSIKERHRFIVVLIQRGAAVNKGKALSSATFRYPLTTAIHINDIQYVKTLINAGADVNLRNSFGYAPIIYSMMFNYMPHTCTKILIDSGAFIPSSDDLIAVPPEIYQFIANRNKTQQAAITMMSTHKKTHMIQQNGKDALRLIAKHIWSMRMGDDTAVS
jgi:hypothetical protein